MSVTNL